MTSPLNPIYDVTMQKYAYSSAGELGTKGLSSCVAVIVVFSNGHVLLEHRSDLEICDEGLEEDARELFRDIIDNIISIDKQQLNISYAFIIGGCPDEIRNDLQTSLLSVRKNFLNKDKHESNVGDDLLSQLYRAMKVLNVSWSTEQTIEHGFNEPFIDVLIAHEEDANSYFFIRQGVRLVDRITKQKTAICCGYLRYKLFDNDHTNVQQDNLSLTDAKFYVDSDVAEQHKQEQEYYSILQDTMMKFNANVQSLGATSVNTNVIDFINSINNMFQRMVNSPQQDVLVKKF